jgi:CubicO group peptidase (beta-lactamase class C family)
MSIRNSGLLGRGARQTHAAEIAAIDGPRAAQLDSLFPTMLARHGVVTAGVGVLRNGRLVWTGDYGEQAPGLSASRSTLFNVGSIAKTVVAETILRMAAAGKLSLDEPMAAHWIDRDVAADPRHRALTPRMVLREGETVPVGRQALPPVDRAARGRPVVVRSGATQWSL